MSVLVLLTQNKISVLTLLIQSKNNVFSAAESEHELTDLYCEMLIEKHCIFVLVMVI